MFQEQRELVKTAIEEALNGKKTPQDALNTPAENDTKVIVKYNQGNK